MAHHGQVVRGPSTPRITPISEVTNASISKIEIGNSLPIRITELVNRSVCRSDPLS